MAKKPALAAVAAAFLERFTGLPRAHGVYMIRNGKPTPEGQKVEGSARTVHVGAMAKDWLAHLQGKTGVGIIPIRDDGTVRWGAIDVDDYNLNLGQLEARVRTLALPLILCRTKSGGAHLYLFLNEDVAAALVREKLLEWAAALGYPSVEVFPKQTRLAGLRDTGNWINMPYFGRDRLALRNGKPVTEPADFLKLAEACAITHTTLEQIALPIPPFTDGPPCLERLAAQGFEKGTRNNSVLNIAIYEKKKHGDAFAEHVQTANADFTQLGSREVASVITSVGKKDYGYTCDKEPICSVCDKPTCLTRKYGVGAPEGGRTATKPRKLTDTQRLVTLVTDSGAELFHTADHEAYVTLIQGGQRKTWPVNAIGFKRWLRAGFYAEHQKAPDKQAFANALDLFDARAEHGGPEHPVFLRVGEAEGRLYVDLGDETWRVVEIDANGWRVLAESPVRFWRSGGMLRLPVPEPGASLDELRRFLNLEDEASWVLYRAGLLMAHHPTGPYPVFSFGGDHGSTKSTAVEIMKRLTDPSKPMLRGNVPYEERDLAIAARNNRVLAFDNVSSVNDQQSDMLCRLATGGGFSKKQNYTDTDEINFDATRPVILNGITDPATRDDLRDREVQLWLPSMAEGKYLTEKKFWKAFAKVGGRVLGALYTALSGVLRELPRVKLKGAPRMADFAEWGTAAEKALGLPSGAFLTAYTANRAAAREEFVEHDDVAQAVAKVMAQQAMWIGTTTELHALCSAVMNGNWPTGRPPKSWPDTMQKFKNRFARATPALRATGIDIEKDRNGKVRSRDITLTRGANWKAPPPVPSEEAKATEYEKAAREARPPRPSSSAVTPGTAWI